MAYIHDVSKAVRTVFSHGRYLALGLGSFIAFLAVYSFTLPGVYTGGRVGMISLRFLTPLLGLFSFLMALLLAFIVPFTVYSLSRGIDPPGGSAAGGVLGSLLPPLLCCSPLLPTLAALLGGASPAVFGVSGWIQGFIATNETYILTGATVLLGYSFVRSAAGIGRCSVNLN